MVFQLNEITRRVFFQRISLAFFGETELPPFNPHRSPYDQSTYPGRVRHFYTTLDPPYKHLRTTCFCESVDRTKKKTHSTLTTSSTRLKQCQDLLLCYKNNTLDRNVKSDADLWKAKGIVECIIHPDYGKTYPLAIPFQCFCRREYPYLLSLSIFVSFLFSVGDACASVQ